MIRSLVFALCALFGSSALAQTALEVVRLKNRTAEQVLPAVEPLVEPGGSISGRLNTIFVRASAANRAELKRAIDAIDTAARRLTISVRQDDELATDERSIGGEVRLGRAGAGVRGSAYGTRGESSDRADQQVQTVDGAQALIRIGRSLPLRMEEVIVGAGAVVVSRSLVYRDLGSGFLARATLAGERVSVEISPQHESLSSEQGGAVIRSSRIVTTVSGRLGEWIELGGSQRRAAASRASAARYSTRSRVEQGRVMLRVDAID